jgi:thymidine kinase
MLNVWSSTGSHLTLLRSYECLIVDEAQDLMSVSVWESLNSFVKGGMSTGEWVLFLDPNQNMFNTTEDYKFAIEYLKEPKSFCMFCTKRRPMTST